MNPEKTVMWLAVLSVGGWGLAVMVSDWMGWL